jgi:hypothetical protein
VNKIHSEPINGDISRLAPIKAVCSSNTSYFQIKCTLAIMDKDLSDELK